MEKSKILKNLLLSGETLVMPDAYDPISARVIEFMGFKAVQCSGYSFSIAACKSEETDIDFAENLSLTSKIISAVSIPVMADGEDGFGGVEQIDITIDRFLKIGTAGINLEDQVLEKKSFQKVIDRNVMMEKLRIARKTATQAGNPDFIINGRTDALGASENRRDGLNESIIRANLYLEAGADLVFVTQVKTLDEARILAKEIKGPLSLTAGLTYNINNFSINDLKEIGVARVSLPTIAIMATISALMKSVGYMKTGDFQDILKENILCNHNDINALINFK